jgi:hypothetical protein
VVAHVAPVSNPLEVVVPASEAQVVTALSAQHLAGEEIVDDDGVLKFWLCDDEDAVEIGHEFGDPEASADRIAAAGQAMIQHAERIRYRARMRSAGWT